MNYLSYCQQALVNLMASKLRSFLAVLGILVGSAAVVALISCGRLATEKALEEFKALGTDLLAVSLYQKEGARGSSPEQDSLSVLQWQQIASQVPSIRSIAPYGTTYESVSFQGKPMQAGIIAADENLKKIIHIDLSSGHFVSYLDAFEHFCVIGNGLAKQIRQFSMDEPVGKQLRMGNALYTIIGVAAPWKENAFFNEDINQSVIIPIETLRLVNKDSRLSEAVMLLKPDSPIDEVIDQIKELIHMKLPKLTVFPRSAKQIVASMESQGQIFTLLLAVIGGISLLVGGIGVMNVMLASVSERKKEIGIRKAIGAKNSDIQALFLAESLMLSLLGGLLGVTLGLLFTWIVAYFSGWTFSVAPFPTIAGFIVSAATGIFFGFYPARRAAKLDPIVSLRSD